AHVIVLATTRHFSRRSAPRTSLVAVRCASKKAGGSSKNLGGRSPGKRYGAKKVDGTFVHAGNILATQRLIRWHPGAHVITWAWIKKF
uniref:Ribosomal protein L27 n=1 Tax=Apteryx owenii TaxID=8824 RepID=A0A8B9NR43_APTOW